MSDNEYGGRSLQTSSQMSDGDRENATSINLDKETQLSAAGETDNDDPFINKKISIQSNLLKARSQRTAQKEGDIVSPFLSHYFIHELFTTGSLCEVDGELVLLHRSVSSHSRPGVWPPSSRSAPKLCSFFPIYYKAFT